MEELRYIKLKIMFCYAYLVLLFAIICIVWYKTLHNPESSLNTLKIPFNRIVEIDTSITYECSANDLDSLKEIKTIKIIYK